MFKIGLVAASSVNAVKHQEEVKIYFILEPSIEIH